MLLVLTLRIAAVVALAAGAQAGICRPSAPSYSSIESQLASDENYPSAAGTGPLSTYEVGKSDSETALSTITDQATGEEPTNTGRPENQYGPTAGIPSSLSSTTHPSRTTFQDTFLSTASITKSVPSTMPEQKPTHSTTTIIAPEIPTSQACTAKSGAATSGCANKPDTICGQTGRFQDSHVYLINIFEQYDLVRCKAECEKREDCKSIGFTTGNQCELYRTGVSAMQFEAMDGWYFTVYDAYCFESEDQ
ncbi:hypothetical protein FOPG_17029 [Fusarium oxysporum f. sp. conglutinans race 2 54008]|uniref:Apple domain-containing protein n=3 Tax=Fusarium oxysporum f. sp. conglutinans TaxID=100902 RepID=A0A8H6LGK3_FUSOX|nr:hypothetical protein FOXB_00553 [Fusarium oxysporum f. sp. conglutinans Fo5176]EXL66826.1 hypothetical protein FOPG_17029 [Fusarium oxysporum f. sp. conglutinans race 2 54008]KAF6518266.1 hypothetical protein HZS61_002344 [Fusarium oxysporum f. sp. conglutinans]KAG7000813.1 hypothetical protein FocnCong_v012518 [Fusarium oxysporum f. sp. conglutinans]KAI8406260.1 hypothetical protein FOFC_13730 [Fusarium oxysporum]